MFGGRFPQGLKPATLLALGGTAEAVPFPIGIETGPEAALVLAFGWCWFVDSLVAFSYGICRIPWTQAAAQTELNRIRIFDVRTIQYLKDSDCEREA